MSKQIRFNWRWFYFGWNGPVYWVHVEFGRALNVTIGQKKRKKR